MATSKIEWTEHTWNPVTGCTRVSAGCDNCYAATMTKRLAAMGQEKYEGLINIGKDHFNGAIKLHPDELDKPLRRKKPTTYFVNSMSDLFHKGVPFDFVDKVFAVMALAPQHTFQILTKRPERMAEYFEADDREGRVVDAAFNGAGLDAKRGSHLNRLIGDGLCHRLDAEREQRQWPLPNVWLGTSVEHQDAADERIPHLLRCDAAVRFLSAEPLLGPVDLFSVMMSDGDALGYALYSHGEGAGIDWVIAGGESGRGARPMHPEWVRTIRDQCNAAGVAFFFKQWGAYAPTPHLHADDKTIGLSLSGRASGYASIHDHGAVTMRRVGKHAAGRELDGRTWDEMPAELEAA